MLNLIIIYIGEDKLPIIVLFITYFPRTMRFDSI